MARGNQRDTDRARALARNGKPGATAKDKDGLNALARKDRDTKALQEKQAKKAEKAAAGGESKPSK